MSTPEYGPLLSTLLQFLDKIQFRHAAPQVVIDDQGRERFRVNTGIHCKRGVYKVSVLGSETGKIARFMRSAP